MYCVKCGVRLRPGVQACPLCGTPVWNPDGDAGDTRDNYPDTLPRHHREPNLSALFFVTVLFALTIAVETAICLKLYGEMRWSGFVAGGVALLYVIAVLPFWFRAPKAVIFVPADHAAAALYVLYICLETGGHWYLSFALPLIGASCLLCAAMICLLKYVGRGRAFIFGGFFLLLGGLMVLIEFLQHVTFGTEMFRWSLFPLAGLGTIGLLLLLAGFIQPMRQALRRRFFF